MNPDPIIFAMANPDPDQARGRDGEGEDHRNRPPLPATQINNVLCFPGIFRRPRCEGQR